MAAAICACAWGSAGCSVSPVGSPGSPPSRAAEILEGVSVRAKNNVAELSGVSIDRFEGDRVRYRARVERARIDREMRAADGERIAIEVRDKNGDVVAARVEAASGHTELDAKTIVLKGGVRVTDREGRVLGAESMIYDVAREEIRAPAPVTLEGANFRATGGALIASTSSGAVSVEGPLRALVRPVP